MLHNVTSDQVLHCLHTEYTFKILMKLKLTIQQPLNWKWICPIYKSGKSIRLNWVKHFARFSGQLLGNVGIDINEKVTF